MSARVELGTNTFMPTDWDLFIDETKKGGDLKYLGVLVLHAGVTEGIFSQLAKAKNAVESRGSKVGEVHWKNLGCPETEVAQSWLSHFFSGPMMFFVAARCKQKETKRQAVERVVQALENDDRVPYGLARGSTTVHLDVDPGDPRDILRRLRSHFRLVRAFAWESKGALLLQLCDLLLGIALADSSGEFDNPSSQSSTREKRKRCLLQHARNTAQARCKQGKRNGVILLEADGRMEFLLSGR